jgi:hypothetical protein
MGSFVNDFIFKISIFDKNNFYIGPLYNTGIYSGGGLISRVYIPQIQTKQFPTAWEMARKTRLGPQMYLFSYTQMSQITLLIYLSQNPNLPFNSGSIVPSPGSINNSLIYSTVLYTCPESTNLGLTPSNINLQMVTANSPQDQIWHRLNTSLIGDTIQLGFTLSDAQMTQIDPAGSAYAITGVVANTYPTVIQTTANYGTDDIIQINGVMGMTQLNYDPNINNFYSVISSTSTTVTINIDSTTFDTYISGGTITQFAYTNFGAEIELHSIILDVSPSMLLV